jgi:hypothetical protein
MVRLIEILLGLSACLVLFGVICFSYIIEGKAWGLDPPIRIPFIMIYIPYYFWSFAKNNKNPILIKIANVLVISIVCSGILGLALNNILFDIIDILKIPKYY